MEKKRFLICENFKPELDSVLKECIDGQYEIFTHNSICGCPPIQDELAQNFLEGRQQKFIIGGICVKKILESKPANTFSYSPTNCHAMFAPDAFVTELQSKGAYVITSGWLKNWKKNISSWGFEHDNLKAFFKESIKKIVLLNTILKNDSEQNLIEFSEYVRVAFSSYKIGLSLFKANIEKLLIESEAASFATKLQKKEHDVSMSISLLNEIAFAYTERQVCEQILHMIAMLFAPGWAEIVTFDKLKVKHKYSLNGEKPTYVTPGFNEVFVKLPNAFAINFFYENEKIATLSVHDFMFKHYIDQYLEQAISLAPMCSLAIINAHNFEQIAMQKVELEDALEEIKQIQDQLIESEKLASLGNLVSGIAHEINTPVGIGVTASSNLLQKTNDMQMLFADKTMKKVDLANYFSVVTETAELIYDKMNQTAHLIKSFKQISADEASESKRKFNLKKYIIDIVNSLTPEIKVKNVQFQYDIAPKIELFSYPGAFAQVFTNLILNSFKHGFNTDTNNIISIKAFDTNETLTIIYSDNGIGIDSEMCDVIFDPFTTGNPNLGTGMGMHIVYNIIHKQFNGRILCNCFKETGAGFEITIKK